ncbi:MAG: thiamine biosynthesis protein ThiS [bacterium]
MQVRIVFRPAREPPRDVALSPGATVGDVLRAVGQSPDHTLAIRGSTPVPEDEPVVDGETLVLLSAFSGG